MMAAEIAAARDKREAAIAQRRKVFVGVISVSEPQREDASARSEPHTASNLRRGPEIFESIRLRTEEKGKTPLFLMAEVGDLKMRKARSQFVTNFFGCGGFKIATKYFEKPADIRFGRSRRHRAVQLGSRVCRRRHRAVQEALKAAGRTTPVIIAGNPKDADALKALGVASTLSTSRATRRRRCRRGRRNLHEARFHKDRL